MAIVKNFHSDRLLKKAVVLDLGDLKKQADEIMERARAEATSLVDQAQAEVDRRLAESGQKGYDEGYARGKIEGQEAGTIQAHTEALQEYREQFDSLETTWKQALETWERDRHAMLIRAEEDILSFAFDLAEKIVYRRIEQDPSIVVDQVRSSLELLSRPTSLVVQLHVEDLETVKDALPALGELIPGCKHIDIATSDRVERGGCIVKTISGEIDASIRTQLDRIANTLLPDTRNTNTNQSEGDAS
ncbi:MAG: FliH/SctL family protein [Planctomycetota bacterium]|nr:FliH/SctL family protein [Planctomycetota bacterium]